MAKTLLIAANDSNIRYLLRRYAEESGLSVLSARGADETLDLARRAMPAAIILEVDAGNTDQSGLLCELEGDASTASIPVVLYSWLDDEPAKSVGAAARLHDPLLYADFLVALRDAGVLA